MMLSSLILTGVLTLSNCQSASEANKFEAYREKSIEVLEDSVEVFQFENNNLTLENNFSIIKQKLLKYNKDNLTSNEIELINSEISSDVNYYQIDSLDDFEFKECSNDLISNYNKKLKALDSLSESYVSNSEVNSLCNEFPVKNSKYISDRFYKYENPYGESESIEFPIRNVDESNIKYSTNSYLNSYAFIGLKCNKELCISFYNLIANRGTSQIRNNVSGISSPLKTIYNYLMDLTKLTSVDMSLITTTIMYVSSIFSSFWATFIAVFSSHDIISMIIGSILILIGVTIIIILAIIFVFGFLEKGFVFGWEIYPIFNPKFVKGELL